MTNPKPSNPPLFDSDGYVSLDGMTLRDLLAGWAGAAVLHAICSDPHKSPEDADKAIDYSVKAGLDFADALLRAREEGE